MGEYEGHEARRDRIDVHLHVDPGTVEMIISLIKAAFPPTKPPSPTRLAFELPTLTRNGHMANFPLPNDQVLTVTLKATNAGGAFEPIPSGDVFTVTVSDPASLQAVMGTDASGNAAVVLNALVQTAVGISVTVTDSAGLAAASQLFDIVADSTPTALALDLVDATHTTQAVPTALAPAAPAGTTSPGPGTTVTAGGTVLPNTPAAAAAAVPGRQTSAT